MPLSDCDRVFKVLRDLFKVIKNLAVNLSGKFHCIEYCIDPVSDKWPRKMFFSRPVAGHRALDANTRAGVVILSLVWELHATNGVRVAEHSDQVHDIPRCRCFGKRVVTSDARDASPALGVDV